MVIGDQAVKGLHHARGPEILQDGNIKGDMFLMEIGEQAVKGFAAQGDQKFYEMEILREICF